MGASASREMIADIGICSDVTHIAFGVDANYFRGMGVTITSLVRHNPDRHFIFHVFSFSITEDSRRRLLELENKFDISIVIHLLHADIASDFLQSPCLSQYPLSILVRLFIPDLLQDTTDRVLYMDADVLCFGKIDELLSVNIDDCVAAVVSDELETTVKSQVASLQLPLPHYFNSGIMYINTRKWVETNAQSKTLDYLSKRTLRFPDQDALNVVLNGKTVYVDKKWNFRYHLVDALSKGQHRLDVTEPFIFMHFTGPVKPWQNWCIHEAKSIFIACQSLSAWADVPLDEPATAKELKLFSKFLVKQGWVSRGIYWHTRYLFARLIKNVKSGSSPP